MISSTSTWLHVIVVRHLEIGVAVKGGVYDATITSKAWPIIPDPNLLYRVPGYGFPFKMGGANVGGVYYLSAYY